jgi:hypothetical protein
LTIYSKNRMAMSVTDTPIFSFTPQGGVMECSAFTPVFKVLAVLLVTLPFAWGWQMVSTHALDLTLQSSGWFGAALCLMVYTEWHILRGKTRLDANTLQQSWVWTKRVQLGDLAYAKLIRIPGLDWLIAPRLYTRTYANKLAVFYASDTNMLTEFKRLERELATLRAKR